MPDARSTARAALDTLIFADDAEERARAYNTLRRYLDEEPGPAKPDAPRPQSDDTIHGIRWTDADHDASAHEDWLLAESDRYGFHIEKRDDADRPTLQSDDDAVSWVMHKARKGSDMHARALLITALSYLLLTQQRVKHADLQAALHALRKAHNP